MNIRKLSWCLPITWLLGGCAANATSADEQDARSLDQALVAGRDGDGDGGDIHKVKHVIVLMQENHSFDNYFGALAYAPGSPYHSPRAGEPGRSQAPDSGCPDHDHRCVDGLSCKLDRSGNLHCANSNPDEHSSLVHAFHDSRRCVAPDLEHGWLGTHQEVDFLEPNAGLRRGQNSGFVRVNDLTEQLDNGLENPTEDQTMGFYNQSELPFYYGLAETFALSDRYFASVLGPTFPNRSYLTAATSFGHLTTSDTFPPAGGYKPITKTIFDLLEASGVSWADYFQDAPQAATFRPFGATAVDPHFFPLPLFLAQAAGVPGTPPLATVSFVDPNFGLLGAKAENDEHPPTDIQRGQAFIAQVVGAVRSGPYWQDSVIFFTYDEHGGAYDHVVPPRAAQGGARTPDGIAPGQCADLSNPPASLKPGGGAECAANPLSTTDTSVNDAIALCPELAANPSGPYPERCASFDQLGVRVPFLAISPFSKPHYVSHTVGDHTSILAFIEKAFLSADSKPDGDASRPHLTRRDQFASPLEDLFDFKHSPSLNSAVGVALPPAVDCTPP